ncbi:hypothetical protein CesoFtcFv8_027435 [Champsocephalus esox]|uniref:Uncharacterized protein n=1 Tax=Champsocephalus esox TaxID=159716 RepID=A0AAN8AW06_9TELE|nr:hypothetical protein CesoFtcFv8_027435 [Champsocephalus esox]
MSIFRCEQTPSRSQGITPASGCFMAALLISLSNGRAVQQLSLRQSDWTLSVAGSVLFYSETAPPCRLRAASPVC